MIEIGGTRYNEVLPVTYQKTLDDSLDYGVVTIKGIELSIPFEPLTKILIDNEWFIIQNDKVERTMYSKKLFTHIITFIEETKLLERFVVDNNTITNKITKLYEIKPAYSNFSRSGENTFKQSVAYSTPIFDDTDLTILGILNYFREDYPAIAGSVEDERVGTLTIRNNGVETIYYYTDTDSSFNDKIIRPQEGVLEILYDTAYRIDGNSVPCSVKISIDVFNADMRGREENVDWNISDVVDRLFSITEPILNGQTPRFFFNEEQHQKYSQVLAPEFTFTKSTLKECLMQVGGYIHAIPRLRGNELFFDELGGQTYWEIPQNYVLREASQDIEQYCSDIDTQVSNLVNNDDDLLGTSIEPFNGGWKTPRVETGVVDVRENNCFFETTYPVEKIAKVELGLLGDSDITIGDITNYVYEKDEYDTLSSFEVYYPRSKSFALYYTQGQQHIKGLQFQQQDAVDQYFSNMSIVNIVNQKLGYNYTDATFPIDITKILYRITYVPIITARIKQVKSNLNAVSYKSTLIYNATANKVDTDYYGENLKGVVERLGNIERIYGYNVKSLEDIPQVGWVTTDENYYINFVKYEKYNGYYKINVGLSKDFNKLSEYIGINNNIRMYEVSNKETYERYINYEDMAVLSFETEYSNDNSIVKDDMYKLLANEFDRHTNTSLPGAITGVGAIAYATYTKDGDMRNGQLPAVSFACGNSACFLAKFQDNYGAGNKVEKFDNTLGYQQEKRYNDFYGNFEYLRFADTDGYTTSDYNGYVEMGANLPDLITTNLHGRLFGLGDVEASNVAEYGANALIVKKDNREIPILCYQIHCVTDNDAVVIGSGLPKLFAVKRFDVDNRPDIRCYVSPRKIMKFEKDNVVDNTMQEVTHGAEAVSFVDFYGNNRKCIEFNVEAVPMTCQSILFVDRSVVDGVQKNELIFAYNKYFVRGEIPDLPRIRFDRYNKIYS